MRFIHENKNIQSAIDEDNYNGIVKKIGLSMTKILKKRVLQIKASDNFAIYLKTGLGKPHPLDGELEGCYGISITANFRLVIKPITNAYDIKSLSQCDTILVKGVVDYHGGKCNWILP